MTVFWEPSYKCNLHCKFCYNEVIYNSNNDDLTEIAIERFADLGVDEVIVAGGEPLMLHNLNNILKKLVKYNIHFQIITNGTLINSEFINIYKAYGGKKITVSIDGLEKEHDYIRGTGNFNKAIKGIQKLVKADMIVNSTVTLNKINCYSILEICQLLHNLGISKIRLGRYLPNKNHDTSIFELQTKDLLSIWKEYDVLKEYDDYIQIDTRCFFMFLEKGELIKKCDCMDMTSTFFTVRPSGDITLCPHLDTKIANIYTENKLIIFKKIINFKKKNILNIPETCHICQHKENCMGGCKSLSQIYYNDFNHSDPLCPLIRPIY